MLIHNYTLHSALTLDLRSLTQSVQHIVVWLGGRLFLPSQSSYSVFFLPYFPHSPIHHVDLWLSLWLMFPLCCFPFSFRHNLVTHFFWCSHTHHCVLFFFFVTLAFVSHLLILRLLMSFEYFVFCYFECFVYMHAPFPASLFHYFPLRCISLVNVCMLTPVRAFGFSMHACAACIFEHMLMYANVSLSIWQCANFCLCIYRFVSRCPSLPPSSLISSPSVANQPKTCPITGFVLWVGSG